MLAVPDPCGFAVRHCGFPFPVSGGGCLAAGQCLPRRRVSRRHTNRVIAPPAAHGALRATPRRRPTIGFTKSERHGSQAYEFRIRGHLGETVLSIFPELQARARGPDPVLTGTLPDPGRAARRAGGVRVAWAGAPLSVAAMAVTVAFVAAFGLFGVLAAAVPIMFFGVPLRRCRARGTASRPSSASSGRSARSAPRRTATSTASSSRKPRRRRTSGCCLACGPECPSCSCWASAGTASALAAWRPASQTLPARSRGCRACLTPVRRPDERCHQ